MDEYYLGYSGHMNECIKNYSGSSHEMEAGAAVATFLCSFLHCSSSDVAPCHMFLP